MAIDAVMLNDKGGDAKAEDSEVRNIEETNWILHVVRWVEVY